VLSTQSPQLTTAAQTVSMSAYWIAGNDESFVGRGSKQRDESIRAGACCQQAHYSSLRPREIITNIASDTSAKTLHQQQHL